MGAVALGGAAGGLARWLLTLALPDPTGVPWTTWWINVTGTVALAVLPLLLARLGLRAERRALLAAAAGPGFLGGYTTLSAYALVARHTLIDSDWATTVVMLLGTLALSLAAVTVVRRWETAP